ncbi:MAG: hypothetical protein K0R47_3920 [Brevibacillus sp.]|nr:hypothetical protein [Brevibacillus sp.]
MVRTNVPFRAPWKVPMRRQVEESRLAEEKGEKSEDLWGPAEAEWKKRNTVLRVHL